MARRALVHALALSLLLSALLPLGVAAADPAPPKPSSMAATGDSITRAFNLCIFPFTDCPARSWSTGSNSTVNSHARRLSITGSAFNDAVSGAKMADLPGQMATVASRNVGYVTILMGGNDVCTDTEGAMTHPDAYEAKFREAMEVLRLDDVQPLVYVVGTPNVWMLWNILHTDSSARSAWNSYNICQSLLANPLSMDQADVDRRERVKQRNMELNQRLREVCSDPLYAFCRFDGEGVFGTDFVPNDVSTRDYFHPSTAGQTKLADVSYRLGYWAGSELLPVNDAPVAAFTPPTSCTVGQECTFVDASYDVGETMGGRSWQFGDGGTSTAPSATHTFASTGTFSVTLYAIDAAGATSKVTHPVEVVAPSSGGDTTAPAAPTGVTATAGDGEVTLSWAANTEPDLDGYEVHRSTDGETYGLVGTVDEASSPSHTDTTVVNGTTYYYVVKAFDDAGNRSVASSPAVSATPQASTGGGEQKSMHIGDLDGQATTAARGNNWTATVTIVVVDGDSGPLGGVAVSGTWSTGGSSTCTTEMETGVCQVSVSLNSKKTVSTTFTVTGVQLSGYTYDSSADHDPNPDTEATDIIVAL